MTYLVVFLCVPHTLLHSAIHHLDTYLENDTWRILWHVSVSFNRYNRRTGVALPGCGVLLASSLAECNVPTAI